jgi:uncharacterized protein (DUF433 family)
LILRNYSQPQEVQVISILPEPIPLSTDADGVVRIGGTRVTLDTVVAAFREGATAETIAEQYPSLRLDEVYTVIGYYIRHQDEVNQYLEQRRQAASRVREENEARFPPIGIRDRLLARRPPQG